ncbi:RHOMBOID-like protein 3 [Cinnamomum micranthum f. kanehirae]|uniref:RHOMBOID-like protein n=1 Tax=Cinnamomum micranthum f. kanehirae TaxID=337451 RepID=A0A3S3MCR4_9MAGN|nr:RHOMBOID-like protein 3 [Cinnamomum micranthum f. kanehirae]
MGKRPPPSDMETGPTPPKSSAAHAPGGSHAHAHGHGHGHARPPTSHQYQYVPNTSWTSWLIPTFVVVNVVVFGVSMYINDCPSNTEHPQICIFFPTLGRFSFQPFSQNPPPRPFSHHLFLIRNKFLYGFPLSRLDRMGALYVKKIVAQGEAWRLISCIWLHAGVIHLLANMFSLLFIGIRLEQEFGFVRIGILYVVSGFGGSLISSISIGKSISVGASGALFGFLGAMLSELITNWSNYANKFAALSTLLFVIGINLAVGLLPHVDSSAHIGGFISGFLLGFILLVRPQYGYINRKHVPPGYDMDLLKPKHKPYQYLFFILALILLIAGFVIGLVRLYSRNPNDS